MADYWKSNPRHFCKYCDCWIADNKSTAITDLLAANKVQTVEFSGWRMMAFGGCESKDFHERGKRHQENVKKKIDEIKKKSREDDKADKEMSDTMRKIEKRALASFKKDVKSSPLLQQAYKEKNKLKREAEEAAAADKPPSVATCEPPPPKQAKTDNQAGKKKLWTIAFSDEGYPYFWNQETNEVQWTKPTDYVPEFENRFGKDGPPAPPPDKEEPKGEFVPIPENAEVEEKQGKVQFLMESEEEDEAGPSTIPLPTCEIPLPPPPGTEPPPPPEPEKVERKQARPSDKAYGKWQSMAEEQQKKETPVDFQLPEFEKTKETVVIQAAAKEPKIKFRTKTANPIAQGLAEFKKRKLTQGARNIKKREDDR